MALLVSVVLHLAVFPLPDYFRKDKQPPLPKPENWKFDVLMSSRGEGLSHKPEAPVVQQKATTRTQGEKKPRVKPLVLTKKKSQEVAASKIEETPVKLAEELVVKPPVIVPQPKEAQKQAEALAGAMTNMVNMQYLLGQMRIFQTLSRAHLKSAVQAQFTEEMFRQYIGAVCTVTLTYATQKSIADAKVDCGERRELAEILFSRVNWGALPQPDKYSLAYQRMKITIWFEGFWVNVGLKADD